MSLTDFLEGVVEVREVRNHLERRRAAREAGDQSEHNQLLQMSATVIIAAAAVLSLVKLCIEGDGSNVQDEQNRPVPADI